MEHHSKEKLNLNLIREKLIGKVQCGKVIIRIIDDREYSL